MKRVRRWLSRLLGTFIGQKREGDFSSEIGCHFEMQTEDNLRAGMTPDQARRAALLKFGGVESTREQYRDQRGLPLIETMAQDLRYGGRMLARQPGFTLVATVTLALGIGATTAIFSVVYGVLLQPLPYRDADRVMTLWQKSHKTAAVKEEVALGNFLDWRARNRTFESMAVIEPFSHEMIGEGEPETFPSWLVSEDFFETVSARMLLGRPFAREDFRAPANLERYTAGSAEVVVISHGLWQRRFGGDPNVVGRKINLRERPTLVVGVLPPAFQFPAKRDVYAPRIQTQGDSLDRRSNFRMVVGRLKPGVTPAVAQQDMDTISAALAREYPQTNGDVGVLIVPLKEQLVGEARPALFVLLGAVALLLLIACANVANLLLARGTERQHEFVVRTAIGASRRRIVRQLLTENLLLALVGGALGVTLAAWALTVARRLGPATIPRIEQLELNGFLLAFAVVLSLGTTVLFGMFPALQLGSPRAGMFKMGVRNATSGIARQRTRSVLLVAQVSLALILIVGAGLLTRSFVQLISVDPGFHRDRLVSLEAHIWKRAETPDARRALLEQTLAEIRSVPGVQGAAAVSALPFHPNPIDIHSGFSIPRRENNPGEERTADFTVVTPEYFQVMGIPIQRGRAFLNTDGPKSARVVLINQAMARQFWPGEDPVGRVIKTRGFGSLDWEIAGIAGDTRHTGLDRAPRPEIFFPHSQQPTGSMTYVVRTSGDPASSLNAIKQRIRGVIPNQPFPTIATLDELVDSSIGERRFHLVLLGSFAVIAIGLAAVGIYGVISFMTARRAAEFGVRMALGASRGDILRLVVGGGLVLAAIGLAIGVAASLALTQALKGMLFGVAPTDPITFAAAILILLLVAAASCFIPAVRATRVDPVVALRAE